jgi:uncharacterized protein VirK/YbjX
MSSCEQLSKCSFFEDTLKNKPTALEEIKRRYCRSNFSICARYKVMIVLGGEKVPTDLFPGDSRRANHILVQENLT